MLYFYIIYLHVFYQPAYHEQVVPAVNNYRAVAHRPSHGMLLLSR